MLDHVDAPFADHPTRSTLSRFQARKLRSGSTAAGAALTSAEWTARSRAASMRASDKPKRPSLSSMLLTRSSRGPTAPVRASVTASVTCSEVMPGVAAGSSLESCRPSVQVVRELELRHEVRRELELPRESRPDGWWLQSVPSAIATPIWRSRKFMPTFCAARRTWRTSSSEMVRDSLPRRRDWERLDK